MNLRKLLYACLVAASVGCGSTDKWKQRCEDQHAYTTKLAQELNSEEMKTSLNSRIWCKVEDDYITDRFHLIKVAQEGARDYCYQKQAEASQLITSNENTLTLLVFQKNFSCNGRYAPDLLAQAQEIQVIIDSYQKK